MLERRLDGWSVYLVVLRSSGWTFPVRQNYLKAHLQYLSSHCNSSPHCAGQTTTSALNSEQVSPKLTIPSLLFTSSSDFQFNLLYVIRQQFKPVLQHNVLFQITIFADAKIFNFKINNLKNLDFISSVVHLVSFLPFITHHRRLYS